MALMEMKKKVSQTDVSLEKLADGVDVKWYRKLFQFSILTLCTTKMRR